MSNITSDLRADRLAANFLSSFGVRSYADRRRAHRIHVGVLTVLITLTTVALVTLAGPGFVTWVHQSIVSIHQSIQLVNWSPQS